MSELNQPYLSQVIDAALLAGKAILKVYKSKDTAIDFKKDKSPLTAADLASHKVIENELRKTPYPILSEEGEEMDLQTRLSATHIWIVDPLDGTKEFISGNGEFTVNIALVINCVPVLGVVYAPVTKELYFATDVIGSFKGFVDCEKSYKISELISKAQTLPIYKTVESNYKVVASRSHLTLETQEFIISLEKRHGTVEVTSRGSSLKLCMVAEGKADCYPRFAPTMEWDTAAGHAICKYSGVEVLDWATKKEMRYNKEDLLNNWFLIEIART
jgi:3'(2'), 5'-bisphosphate nucleotidase